MLALLAVQRRLAGVTAAVVARFDAGGGGWAAEGARSPQAWIRGRSVEGYGPAKRVVEWGTWSARFPVMQAALVAGRVSVAHVKALAGAHARFPRLSAGLSAQEALIVDLAVTCEPRVFQRALLTLCHRLDPAAVDEAMDGEHRHDYLALSTSLDGRVRVDGWFPADLGAHLLAALEAAKRAVTVPTDPDTDPDPDPDPDPETPPEHPRPASTRNLDALRRILTAAAAGTGEEGLPAVAGARPVVHVTVPADALTDGNVLGVLERAGIPHAALAATQTAQATCDATLTPWMITRTGAVQAQLPRVRAIHPAMRRAITVRDAHCRFPGRWARIDEIPHLIYWRHGGETRRSNLVELCWHHHHPAHQHRHIAGNPETTLTFTNTRARHHYTSDPPRWN